MGFIWPMLAVATAAMVMRLPGKWLRVPVIIFLLGLNLGVGGFRILADTEPPVDRMAADAFAAENPMNHMMLWTHLAPSMQSPGGANLYGEPGQYYLQLLENKPTDPVRFLSQLRDRQRSSAVRKRSMSWRHGVPTGINEMIVWTQYSPGGEAIAPEIAAPPDWSLQSEEWFASRDCWIWQDLARYHRCVYVRNQAATTRAISAGQPHVAATPASSRGFPSENGDAGVAATGSGRGRSPTRLP